MLYELNDKPAVKIFAKKLVDKPNNKAILFDCEGDKIWLPRSTVKVIDSKTILIEEWIYKQKFENIGR
jgi:hypothetical protein